MAKKKIHTVNKFVRYTQDEVDQIVGELQARIADLNEELQKRLDASVKTEPMTFGWKRVDPAAYSKSESTQPVENTAAASKPTNPKDVVAINKLPLHLISPVVKAYLSIAQYLGLVKYGAWNWRLGGARASTYKSALENHLDAWWEGEEIDSVDGTPHLANALCCLQVLIDAKHSKGLNDDRPPRNHSELLAVRTEFEAMMPKIREKYKDRKVKHWSIED